MFKKSMTDNTHWIIKEHIKKWGKQGLIAVDGTLGNGHDLSFLCSQKEVEKVVGFDIQEQAITISQDQIRNCSKDVNLFNVSHHQLDQYVSLIDIAMFNLGYLPNGNKEIVTYTATSLIAIQKATILLSKGGIITVMTYPGHEEGYTEHQAIEEYFSSLYEPSLSIFNLTLKNTKKLCPCLYIIIKK